MLIKREVFDQIDPFQEGLTSGEDLDLWLRIAYRYPKIGYVNRPLALYSWKRPGSLAERPITERLNIVFNMLDRQIELASQNGQRQNLKKLINKMLNQHLYYLYHHNTSQDIRQLVAAYSRLFSFRQKAAIRIITTILTPSVPYAAKLTRKLLGGV